MASMPRAPRRWLDIGDLALGAGSGNPRSPQEGLGPKIQMPVTMARERRQGHVWDHLSSRVSGGEVHARGLCPP